MDVVSLKNSILEEEAQVFFRKATEIIQSDILHSEKIVAIENVKRELSSFQKKTEDSNVPWPESSCCHPSAFAALEDEINSCEAACWKERIEFGDKVLKTLLKDSQYETDVLEEELARSAREGPMIKGRDPSRTELSLKELREKLRLLEDRESQSQCSSMEQHEVEDVHDKALRLQVSFRRHEAKTFENEKDWSHKSEDTSIDLDAEETTVQRERITALGLQSQLKDRIATMDDVEEHKGYVRATAKIVSAIECITNKKFCYIPAGHYECGQKNASFPSTMFPIGGSSDRAAIYDRRTPLWLAGKAENRSLHYFYNSRRRAVDIPAFYVSQQPVTIGDFAALLKDKAFSSKLQRVVPDKYLLKERKTLYTPTITCGELNRFLEEEQKMTVEEGAEENLEVPYCVASAVCEALGGVVCPSDVWETAAMGPCGPKDFLFKRSSVEGHVEKLQFTALASGTERTVSGVVTRISSAGRRFLQQADPQSSSGFGMRGICRIGHEWNSHLTIVEKTLANNLPFSPTYILRSSSDYLTQCFFDGSVSTPDGRTCDPDNSSCFVGTALHTFGIPNRGIPVASFRVAIPVFREGEEKLLLAIKEHSMRQGCDIDCHRMLSQLMQPKIAVQQKFPHMRLDSVDVFEDTLYGTKCHAFQGSGLDLVFNGSFPHVLQTISFHAASRYEVVMVEYSSFPFPFFTDSCPPLSLSSEEDFDEWAQELEEILRLKDEKVRSGTDSVSFEDTITFNKGTASERIQQVRVNIICEKEKRTIKRIDVSAVP